ncbi:MAG: lysophospholipid acyltransferase family protein [Minisyncoccota bacterium]
MSLSKTVRGKESPVMGKWYFINPLILQKLIWVPTRLILILFGGLEVKGLDNLKGIKSNAIFACNHVSELDPLLIPAALPFWSRFSPIFYTSRERDFYDESGWKQFFYGGTLFKAWGAYPVRVGLHNYEKSVKTHIRIIKDGGSVCVFPEGEITHNGNIQQAKGGVAYLAHATKAPVVPVRIEGVYGLKFSDFLLRRRKISIHFGKPLYVTASNDSAMSIEEFKKWANVVMSAVGEMAPTATTRTHSVV